MKASSFVGLFLGNDGTIWEWDSRHVQPDPTLHMEPIPLSELQFVTRIERTISVDVNGFVRLALTDDGTVWHWGRDETPEQVRDLNNVVQISAGYSHGLALRSDGTVWEWGELVGQPVVDPPLVAQEPVRIEPLPRIRTIEAGASHNLALDEEGRAWAWGKNEFGALGDGSEICLLREATNANCTEYTTEIPFEPTPVPVVTLTAIKALSAYYESLALLEDGSVWDWGYGYKTTPQRVAGLSEIAAISTGDNIHAALKKDGTVWVWGDILNADMHPRNPTPRQVSNLNDAIAVEAVNGYDRMVIVQRANGSFWIAQLPAEVP